MLPDGLSAPTFQRWWLSRARHSSCRTARSCVSRPRSRQPAATAEAAAAKIPNDQLDSLVAPIALYPDPLLEPDARRLDLSAGNRPAAAVAGEEQEPEGQGADRRGHEAALGCEHSGDGRAARRRQAAGRRHSVDDRPRQRLPRAAERRDGRRAAHAQEGAGHRRARVERAAEGGNQGRREQDRDRRRASEPGGRLRAVVQSGRGLRAADLSVPADLLPAVPAGGRRRDEHDLVRRRRRRGRGVGRRRWGWGCGWGGNDIDINVEQQLRPQQQHQQEHQHQRQPGRHTNKWQHDARHRGGAPYGEQGHGRSVRRDRARRLAVVAAVDRRVAVGERRAPAGQSGNRRQAAAHRAAQGASRSGGGDKVGSREVPRSSGVERAARSVAAPAGPAAPRPAAAVARAAGAARAAADAGR